MRRSFTKRKHPGSPLPEQKVVGYEKQRWRKADDAQDELQEAEAISKEVCVPGSPSLYSLTYEYDSDEPDDVRPASHREEF
jgi:hypothetical protein